MMDLAQLQALSFAATPGPWEPRRMPGAHPDQDAQFTVATAAGDQVADCHDNTQHSDAQITANAAFIAVARSAIPELLAERNDYRARIALLENHVRQLVALVSNGFMSHENQMILRAAKASLEPQEPQEETQP